MALINNGTLTHGTLSHLDNMQKNDKRNYV